jgi:Raf kinase inhibitor-like YbhB/YbcL family protein
MSLSVRSPAFTEGHSIPRRHTGDGEDLSPPLSWSTLPTGTKELALIVDDPDAPTGEPWVHWVIYGIPATAEELPEGVAPVSNPPVPAGAIQGKNTWGTPGYRGPAPPKGHGVHHYHFKLYALDAPLGLEPGLDKHDLMLAMSGHILGHGELVGTYQR